MHYLIDGHNLIARLPDIDLSDPHDEVKLVLLLRGWASAKRRRRVTLYFDGGLPGGEAKRLSSGDMRVVFASAGRTADALIISHIGRLKNPGSATLITSDEAIIKVARARRLSVIRAEDFAEKLTVEQAARRPSPPPAVDEADDPQLTEAELAEWLDLFGPVPERPSPPPRPPRRRSAPPPAPQEPARPRLDPAQAKHTDYALDAGEVADWLQIFGFEETAPPAAEETPPPQTQRPARPSPRRPAPAADDSLNPTDRAVWEAYFGDEK